MRPFCSLLTLGMATLGALMGLESTGHAANLRTFDAPNAVNTFPVAINDFGRSTGYYSDINEVDHGFVRTRSGAFISFDAPGAGTARGEGTVPAAINVFGQIAGTANAVTDNNFVAQGFLREPNGSIIAFDAAPDALRTLATAINEEGWIAGFYSDTNFFGHCFVREFGGTITVYDVPGFIWNIDEIGPGGAVVGSYLESDGTMRGFVRKIDGTIVSFDAPGAAKTGGVGCGHCSGTLATAAKTAGAIVGYSRDVNQIVHGFLRRGNGAFTTIDVPGATSTIPYAINWEGQIAGQSADASFQEHNFVMRRDGTVQTFDVAGSTSTRVTGMNLEEQVIGYYSDASFVYHGFIRSR